MNKRKPPVAKQPELTLRPYVDQTLTEHEHYALEYARLIDAVHSAVVAGAGATDVVVSGLIVLALNSPETYSAIVRNSEAADATLKTVNDAAGTINDALGLSWGTRVNGGDGAPFGVTLF